jgi:hypothetical protein
MTSYDSAQTHNRHRPCHPEHHAPLCLAVVSHQLPLYRIVAFTLFTPLVSGLTWLFLAGSGRIVVTNEKIAAFFFKPLRFFALIVMAAVSLTRIALEQSC